MGWKFDGEFLSREMGTELIVENDAQTVDAVFRRAGDITGDARIDLNDFAVFAVCYGGAWGGEIAFCFILSDPGPRCSDLSSLFAES